MLPRPEDKRRFPRLNLRTPIRYQLRGQPEFDNVVSDNISVGGLSFIGNKFIPPSTPMMFEINVLSRTLRPIGEVAWSVPLPHSDRNRLGVRFVEIDPIEKNYLSDYISMQMGRLL